jgi:hypothetical protein
MENNGALDTSEKILSVQVNVIDSCPFEQNNRVQITNLAFFFCNFTLIIIFLSLIFGKKVPVPLLPLTHSFKSEYVL